MATTSLTPDLSAALTGETPQTRARHIRLDIQVLRGLAILLVLLHHARMPAPTGGFLGVDIFFVVSGYLMTGLIDEGLENGRFTLRGFYARRVRRLLPAAYATLVVTALLAPWLLDAQEYGNFVAQLAGSFGFVSNVVLWRQIDYFDSGAALKPLLHIWSLSLEEQYYLALPLVLLLSPRRWRLPLVAALTLGSGLLCLHFRSILPAPTFYLLPTRAWELGLGSATALLLRRQVVRPGIPDGVRAIAWATLVAVPFLADERGHPGVPALLVCLATAMLMVPGRGRARSPALLAPATALGDRSYSLYLVHWPVFAFVNNVSITAVPLATDALLLLVCLLWTEAQFRLVEQRWRGLRLTRRAVTVLVATPLLTVGASAAWQHAARPAGTEPRRPNEGLSYACAFDRAFAPSAACYSAPHPTTLLWGDSFAMAISPGLAATVPGGIIQATKFTCGPFAGIAPFNDQAQSRDWARSCIAFNASVLDWLARHPEVRTVVLSSATVQYVPGGEPLPWRLLTATPGGGERVGPLDRTALLRSVAWTADRLRAMGKGVIFFAPPPAIGTDLARCASRRRVGLPTWTPRADCAFTRADYRRFRAPVLETVAMMRAAVPVVSFDDAICDGELCRPEQGGTLLYRDPAHLSIAGSLLLARRMGWADRIAADAR